MMRWRGALVAVASALSLSACVSDDLYFDDTTVYGGYGGGQPGYSSPPPTYRDGWGRPDSYAPPWGAPPPAYVYRPPTYGYVPPPSYGYSGGLGLNDVQENALIDGCRQRYAGNPRKLRACLNGGANAGAALAQGCEYRYSGNPKKYRSCMGF